MNAIPDAAAKNLLDMPSTATVRPLFEGNNISFALGFKHINYLVESAILEHFRTVEVPVGQLYLRHALGFDIVDVKARLGAFLAVDDLVTAEVKPVTKDSDTQIRFAVTLHVQRDGERVQVAGAKAGVVLRKDNHVAPEFPPPIPLERFVVDRLATATPRSLRATPATGTDLSAGRGVTSGDPVLAELTEGENAFGWKWRIPYFYCHYNDRMQMSAFLRIMEEVVDLFLADRGLPIKKVLDERNWIPVVTQSNITVLDEVVMEEELYTVYTVENVFKRLLYTSRMDCYVVRDGALVPVATGNITHGYVTERAQNDWVMADFDDEALASFSGTGEAVR